MSTAGVNVGSTVRLLEVKPVLSLHKMKEAGEQKESKNGKQRTIVWKHVSKEAYRLRRWT